MELGLFFDYVSVIFWSIAYVLMIVAGCYNIYRYKIKLFDDTSGNYAKSIPFFSILCNFSWEATACAQSGSWGQIMWFVIDCFLLFVALFFLKDAKKRIIYLLSYGVGMIIFKIIFDNGGMMISSFVIDILMAILFVVERKRISKVLKIPVAAFKLIGDLGAVLFYYKYSNVILVIGSIVFWLNTFYLIYSIRERKTVIK